MEETQSFVFRYDDFVDELTTPCKVYQARQGMLTDGSIILHGQYEALWDTGATNSMITTRVIRELELKPVTYATIYHVGGASQEAVYNAYISLPNDILIGPLQVIEGQLEGVDVLIGMDIIGSGDLVVTNNDEHTEMAYTVPSVMKLK